MNLNERLKKKAAEFTRSKKPPEKAAFIDKFLHRVYTVSSREDGGWLLTKAKAR